MLRFVSLKKRVSACTGKIIKSSTSSTVRDHMLVCDNIVPFKQFSALTNGSSYFRKCYKKVF